MAGENLLAFQVRKLRQQILNRIATSQVFQDGFYRIAQTADARFPVTHFWINGDS